MTEEAFNETEQQAKQRKEAVKAAMNKEKLMSNPPAFPRNILDHGHGIMSTHESGMTLRDYFAAKAMQGYCSDPEYKKECGQEDTAISAYKMADAMLKAREA